MNISNGIGKLTVEGMKRCGIDSIEKLAKCNVEDLLKIDNMDVSIAKMCIQIAQKHIESMSSKERINNLISERLMAKTSNTDNLKVRPSISSIKKIASSKAEEISQAKGIAISNAKKYIDIAKKYLESMRLKEGEDNYNRGKLIQDSPTIDDTDDLKLVDKLDKPNIQQLPQKVKMSGLVLLKSPSKVKLELPPLKVEDFYPKNPKLKPVPSQTSTQKQIETPVIKKETTQKKLLVKPFFSTETMQRIRFLHYKIKKLEEALQKKEEISFSDFNIILDYIQILNINYKTQSQIKIFKELEISSSFLDPIENREIIIWDLIFECSRVLWVSAQVYSYLSRKFELDNLMEKSIVAMVECSKMYKTAAYFSAACTRQEDKGFTLSVDNLELNSEESRIQAQYLATLSEEKKGDFSMAANLSAGLSALTKRLIFLKTFTNIKENHIKAQYNYDSGRACHLKAKSLLQESNEEGENEAKIENLQKKANYYYYQAEELWDSLLRCEELTDREARSISSNLSIINELIIENDVENITEEESYKIQDPEPLIIIPENLAPFIPRTTNYLSKYNQSDLNFDAFLRYKNLMSDISVNFNKIDELLNNKAGIGRTMKQLKILYDNNDIDINSFNQLFEKYAIKLETIESAIQTLKNIPNKPLIKQQQKSILKTNI